MTSSTLQNLPSKDFADAADLLYLVTADNLNRKVRVDDLLPGLPVATPSVKGVMSAADKTLLDALGPRVTALENFPYAFIASDTVLALTAGVYTYILSGTSTVAGVSGAEDYRQYAFYYPAGAGVNMMGQLMIAGDVLMFFAVP